MPLSAGSEGPPGRGIHHEGHKGHEVQVHPKAPYRREARVLSFPSFFVSFVPFVVKNGASPKIAELCERPWVPALRFAAAGMTARIRLFLKQAPRIMTKT
jgi:hypothetical protein